MKVESVAVDGLSFDPSNARKHSDKNLGAIQGSLERFGQRKPIVVTAENVVVAGNGTLQAALNLGWKKIDVVRVPADWSADQVKAFALADNRTAELAEWDGQVLSAQLLELYEVDFDVEALGFELPQEIETQVINEDEIPVPETSRVKSGQTWILGNHRLHCGDALQASSYDLLLGEAKADLVWTDPPYGVDIVGGNRSLTPSERKAKGGLEIENDNLKDLELQQFLQDAFSLMFAYCKPGGCWYVAAPSGNLFIHFAIPLFELEVWKHTIVWVKDSLVMGRADYHYRHESIFYGWKPGAAHQEPPNRKQDTVWEIARPKVNKEHPTMKPIELIVKSIENSSRVGDIVLDSFGGSGSTLIACEQSKRKAYLLELDPKYCDVIIARWEKITGEKAVLENASG